MNTTDQKHEALESAVALFQDIYRETETWPRNQVFGLIMDIRRAAMEVSVNLTEGRNREWAESSGEFVRLSLENLSQLKVHLLEAKNNTALAAAKIDGLLQQLSQLDGRLQNLAASLS